MEMTQETIEKARQQLAKLVASEARVWEDEFTSARQRMYRMEYRRDEARENELRIKKIQEKIEGGGLPCQWTFATYASTGTTQYTFWTSKYEFLVSIKEDKTKKRERFYVTANVNKYYLDNYWFRLEYDYTERTFKNEIADNPASGYKYIVRKFKTLEEAEQAVKDFMLFFTDKYQDELKLDYAYLNGTDYVMTYESKID